MKERNLGFLREAVMVWSARETEGCDLRAEQLNGDEEKREPSKQRESGGERKR